MVANQTKTAYLPAGHTGFLFAYQEPVIQMRLNSKTAKRLRKVARALDPRFKPDDSQPRYADRQYKQIHFKDTVLHWLTGKPFLERDTGVPVLVDEVKAQPQPVRLADGSWRRLYRALKNAQHRMRSLTTAEFLRTRPA
jgi:hypothetical protein